MMNKYRPTIKIASAYIAFLIGIVAFNQKEDYVRLIVVTSPFFVFFIVVTFIKAQKNNKHDNKR